jgi:hypothetical protein
MRKLIVALLIAVAAAGCTAPPPPYESGPDFGPDRGTPEHQEACRTHPEVNDCP